MVKQTKTEKKRDFGNEIKFGVDALFKLIDAAPNKKLLLDNGTSIFLQVTLFKVPEVDELVKRRITLPHPVTSGKPEVCLMVRDYLAKDKVKRTLDEKIDRTIEHYEKILKLHNVNSITNILPLKQLRTEYNTYELQRKLVNRFDVFLCEATLLTRIAFLNGLRVKIFLQKNKYPIAVKIPKVSTHKPMVAMRMNSAIASTVFHIKPGADNYSIRIGNSLKSKEEIIENAKTVMEKLASVIPGGFENIRAVMMKSEKSKAVPIYMSLASGNDVPVPYVPPNGAMQPSIEGTISTRPGKKVTILPTGEVFVTNIGGADVSDSDSDDDDMDEYDANDVDDGMIKEQKQEKGKKSEAKKKAAEEEEDDDDEEAEEAIESAEQRYLSTLDDAFESSEDEQKPEGKPTKGKKRKQLQEVSPSKKMKKDGPKPGKESKLGKKNKIKLKEKPAKNEKTKSGSFNKNKAEKNVSPKGLKPAKTINSAKKIKNEGKRDSLSKPKSMKKNGKNIVSKPQVKTLQKNKKSKKHKKC
ncbi:UNVERIFIED_CONTAM: hypothetical protein PYX00_000528 [Menopon gallinae]|uniref:Ribosomal protein L1 n=1 Tax=Menopon gallinae TaxID=328185 RepID=A0AAW2I9F0_9NEOP